MKGQELKPLEDWVLKDEEDLKSYSKSDYEISGVYHPHEENIYQLAKLLKSTPKLGDFIPCDEDCDPLDKPYEGLFEIKENQKCSGWAYLYEDREHEEDCRYYDKVSFDKAFKAYQEAEQRVLWKGEWEIRHESAEFGAQGTCSTWLEDGDTGKILDLEEINTYSELTNKGLIFKREL